MVKIHDPRVILSSTVHTGLAFKTINKLTVSLDSLLTISSSPQSVLFYLRLFPSVSTTKNLHT